MFNIGDKVKIKEHSTDSLIGKKAIVVDNRGRFLDLIIEESSLKVFCVPSEVELTDCLYFETHITCDAGDDWDHFCKIIPDEFRASKFDEDLVDNYNGKWFLSSRGDDIESVKIQIYETVNLLKYFGYNPIRFKIEQAIIDSKYGDTLESLISEITA